MEIVAGIIVPRLIKRGPRSARVALVAGGALLLGGDRIDIAVDVADGCALDLEDIGGTVAYGGDGLASFWELEIAVGADARLSWAGKPLIVADGADVHRTTRIRLGAGARVLARESVVLGRSGERGGRLRSQMRVHDAHGAVLEESLDVDGASPVPGVIGRHRVIDTLLCLGVRPPSVVGGDVTVMPLDEPGSVARHLGSAAHASPLGRIWNEWAPSMASEQRKNHDAFA